MQGLFAGQASGDEVAEERQPAGTVHAGGEQRVHGTRHYHRYGRSRDYERMQTVLEGVHSVAFALLALHAGAPLLWVL